MNSDTELNIWSVFLILGIFQGFFVTPLLLRKKTMAGRWLAALVVVATLNLCNYLAINLRLYYYWPHFVDTTLPLLFLIGPIYYFYIRSLLDKSFSLKRNDLIHFIPLLVAIAFHWNFYLMLGEYKIAIIENTRHSSQEIRLGSGIIMYILGHISLTLFYIIKSYIFLRKSDISVNEQNRKFMRWLKSFSLGFALYWLFTFIWIMYLIVAKQFFFEADYLFMLFTALLINLLAYLAIYKNKDFSLYLLAVLNEKYKKSSLSKDQAIGLMNKLARLMKDEKPYLDPDLRISDLAKRLSTSTNIISQVLNQEMDKNFFEFINEYRIAEAMKRLSDPKFSHISILGIAMDSGFNNKNTFNRLFKKHTGLTPSQFIRGT